MKTPTMSSHWSQGSKIITLNLLKIRAKPPGFVNYYSFHNVMTFIANFLDFINRKKQRNFIRI